MTVDILDDLPNRIVVDISQLPVADQIDQKAFELNGVLFPKEDLLHLKFFDDFADFRFEEFHIGMEEGLIQRRCIRETDLLMGIFRLEKSRRTGNQIVTCVIVGLCVVKIENCQRDGVNGANAILCTGLEDHQRTFLHVVFLPRHVQRRRAFEGIQKTAVIGFGRTTLQFKAQYIRKADIGGYVDQFHEVHHRSEEVFVIIP